MPVRLSAQSRLNLILSVLKKEKKVTQVCKEAGISRKTFYKWLRRYEGAPAGEKLDSLKDWEWKLPLHGRKIPSAREKLVLDIVYKNPKLGLIRIRKKLIDKKGRPVLSKHGIANVLSRYALKDYDLRLIYKKDRQKKGLTFQDRYLLFLSTLKEGRKIASVCREFGISRKTYYKWYKRYQETQELSLGRFKDWEWKIEVHPRKVPEEKEKRIISLVIQKPELSSHVLARIVGIGNHGVQNILARNGLNLYGRRLAFSQAQRPLPSKVPAFVWLEDRIRLVWEEFIPSLAPAPPPARLLKPFLISSFFSFFISLGILSWIRLLTAVPSLGATVGLIFASIALLMGSIFFLYSLKYYLTLAIVLSFSQRGGENGYTNPNGNGNRGKRNFISWILGLTKNGNGPSTEFIPSGVEGFGATGPVGLEPDLEHVKLKRYPYLSVHIPFYNEKNVVERAIQASTNFNYQGEYEVILADDSTDETTKIIESYLVTKGTKLLREEGDGWTLTQAEVRPGVTLKHLHRTTRAGFKGGALREALKHTDPKAEFISVFDADFVPYPDTLELFLKYFQVTAGTLDFSKKSRMVNGQWSMVNEKGKETINHQPSTISHQIAAVQGYQWHVLNKSENWITRGVRSEYAGSYVIERSGTEIYSGLKQISGSVYMIRRDVLEEVGWETSITEDFQLTLKLYEAGYKVVYTPYVQAPAECVSTIKRLIRQRMRWAEGHSNNVKHMFKKLLLSPNLTRAEKLEFMYLSPYYLQAFFFLVGTISWLISETLFPARLPFWTSLWGWSLVLTNMLSLPLMNAVGLFLEESEEKDYAGLASFVTLSYILVPFQAYAALKGFLESQEGPWFRTPKTGKITDILSRGRFYRLIAGIFPGRVGSHGIVPALAYLGSKNPYLSLATANNTFSNFKIRPRRLKWVSKATLAVFLIIVMLLNYLSFFTSTASAQASDPSIEQQINIIDQEYSTTSTSAAPTDNSLGYIYWDSAKYSGTRTISLDIVGRTSATSAQMIVALYDDSGSIVSQSKTTIGNANKISHLDGCVECDSTGSMIYTHGIVLDSNGYPVISYMDGTNDDLKLIHCGNANCTSGNVITTVDGCATCDLNGAVDKHSSIVLNSSGYPVIAYHDATNSDLKLVVCGNANCSSGNTYTTVDNGGTDDVGTYAFMRLNSSGYPVITYFNEIQGDLEFAYCNNATCTSPTLSTLDGCSGCNSNSSAGQYNTFEFDTASSTCTSGTKECPVIAYRSGASDHDLKLLHCTVNNCSSGNYNVVDNGTGLTDSAGIYNSLKLDSSGFPVISFGRGQFVANLDLKIAHCNDVNCSGSDETINVLDGQGSGANCASATGSDCDSGDVGWYNKLQLDSSGYPIISYRSQEAGDLKVIHCNDANCSGNNDSVKRVDGCTGCDTDGSSGSTGAGGYTALALDSSGYPVVAYRSVGDSEDLKVVHCGNSDCNPTGSGQVNPTNNQRAESMVFTPNLTGGSTTRNLSVRVWVTSGTGYIRAARLKIVQNDATKITDTQTQVELGDDETITATSYSELTNPKYYYLDTSKFSGTKSAYFEASLKGEGSQGNGRMWSSGYELGSTTNDMEWVTFAGTTSVQSTTARSGTYALQVNTTTATGTGTTQFHGTAVDDNVYVRAYVRRANAPSAATDIILLRTALATRATIRMNTDGSLQLRNASAQVGSNSSILSTDTWYRVELHYDSTQAAGSDILDARLDGTSFASSTAESLNTIGRLRVGVDISSTVNIYFDDVALNDSTGGWPGPGKIIHLKPNAAGDNSDWTNDYTYVDEVPPDDATTLVSSNTANQIDDHALENSSLASNDDVNVVSIGVRFNGAGASANASFVVRVKETSGATAEESSAIAASDTTWKTNVDSGDKLYPITMYDLPGSSTTEWSDGTLDTAQIGYRLSTASTNAAQISAVWMLVDYTPNADITGVSAQAKLQQCDEASCTWTDVTGSSISSTTSTFQRVRSSDIAANLTSGRRYRVVISRSSASGTIKIANAKLIIGQTDSGGLTAMELVHEYVNSNTSETGTSLTAKDFDNEFDDDNFVGGTFSYYYEATMYCTTGCTATTDLYNGTSSITNSSITTISETPTRVRSGSALSGMPTTATNLDTRLQATSGDTTYANTTWLIIQISNLQIPENLLLFLPLVLFLPAIIKRFRLKKLAFATQTTLQNDMSIVISKSKVGGEKRRLIEDG